MQEPLGADLQTGKLSIVESKEWANTMSGDGSNHTKAGSM